MEQTTKRKAGEDDSTAPDKRRKKQWRVPRGQNGPAAQSKSIQPGDSGIWATCDKGREGKCIGELRDLFTQYAEEMHGDVLKDAREEEDGGDAGAADDIELDIQAEIKDLHHAKATQLFTPLRVDVQCVVFIKTEPPVDPVKLVQTICQEAMQAPGRKRTRFVKRLSPMTLLGRASEEGLEKVAAQVLAPHFHQPGGVAQKFAIRPTLRNHNVLNREGVIHQVAKIVGPGHRVNLKDYDLLVIVEVYKNVCGVSVVDGSFDAMKRFNLAEIFHPTPRVDGDNNSSGRDGGKTRIVDNDSDDKDKDEDKGSTVSPPWQAGAADAGATGAD